MNRVGSPSIASENNWTLEISQNEDNTIKKKKGEQKIEYMNRLIQSHKLKKDTLGNRILKVYEKIPPWVVIFVQGVLLFSFSLVIVATGIIISWESTHPYNEMERDINIAKQYQKYIHQLDIEQLGALYSQITPISKNIQKAYLGTVELNEYERRELIFQLKQVEGEERHITIALESLQNLTIAQEKVGNENNTQSVYEEYSTIRQTGNQVVHTLLEILPVRQLRQSHLLKRSMDNHARFWDILTLALYKSYTKTDHLSKNTMEMALTYYLDMENQRRMLDSNQTYPLIEAIKDGSVSNITKQLYPNWTIVDFQKYLNEKHVSMKKDQEDFMESLVNTVSTYEANQFSLQIVLWIIIAIYIITFFIVWSCSCLCFQGTFHRYHTFTQQEEAVAEGIIEYLKRGKGDQELAILSIPDRELTKVELAFKEAIFALQSK